MQSSNILIGGGTQKTHQMKGPFMMKQPHQYHSHTIITSTEKDETQRRSSTPPACQASDPWPLTSTLYVSMDRVMTAVWDLVQLLFQGEDVSDGGPETRELRDELQSVAVDW